MENLTEDQRQALDQLRTLTDGADDEVSVNVLSSVNWDVQMAAELIFGSVSPPQNRSNQLPQTRMERLEFNDVRYDHDGHRWKYRILQWIPGPLLSFFYFPFHILASTVRYIFGTLRIPFPHLPFTSLNHNRLRSGTSHPRGGVDRWIRQLEEETGAVCISRARNTPNSITSSAEVGPSILKSRSVMPELVSDGSRKILPDFRTTSYDEALRICQKEARIGCIILVSEEHDDVPEFKRTTLTNTTFVKFLYDNDILVWGGDVRDQEAWTAAQKLQVTTYPFVAFLALQPRRNPSTISSRTTNPPILSVISRHHGHCIPVSAPTSPRSLIEHLEQQILPRVAPFLERVKLSQKEREQERILREEQDRAFRRSAQRDLEKIATKMAAERLELEEKQRRRDEAHSEELRKQKEEEKRLRLRELRMNWRRWTRYAVPFPDSHHSKEVLRIAIRFPEGRRIIHHFPPTATLTTLYAFVDVQLLPPNILPEADPRSPPDGTLSGESAIEHQILNSDGKEVWWGFKLVQPYPRQEIRWEVGRRLSEVEGLAGRGQVVVEMIEKIIPTDEDEASDGCSSEDRG